MTPVNLESSVPFFSENGNTDTLFLKNDEKQIISSLLSATTLSVAQLISSYIVSNEVAFGTKEWEEYYGVNVDDLKLPRNFYDFWWGLDPLDLSKQVCETHFPPVLSPNKVRVIDSQKIETFNLNVLSRLVENPKKGKASCINISKLELKNELFDYYNHFLSDPIFSKLSYWIIMRKNVILRNSRYEHEREEIKKLNASTGFGYEESNSAIDLATVVLTQQVVSGKFFLGTETGMEGRLTFAYAREYYRRGHGSYPVYQAIVGAFCAPGPKKNGLLISSCSELDRDQKIGSALIKKLNFETKKEEGCMLL